MLINSLPARKGIMAYLEKQGAAHRGMKWTRQRTSVPGLTEPAIKFTEGREDGDRGTERGISLV